MVVVSEPRSQITDELSLFDFGKTQANNLSGYNKRQLSLGVTVTGRPKVLLLDKSSSGKKHYLRCFLVVNSRIFRREFEFFTITVEQTLCLFTGI